MKTAGLDIGTTGCKCTVFDEAGDFLGTAYRSYPTQQEGGRRTVDAVRIEEAVFAVLAEMAGRFPDIGGIGVTSFGETFVAVDREGIPLSSAMLYTDERGTKECDELVGHLGQRRIFCLTGLRPHPMYSISKLMWLFRNREKLREKTARIFLIQDYIVYRLTGQRQIDFSLASRTMAFDIHRLEWSHEILKAAGIDEELFSKPVPSGTVAGPLLPSAAERIGLRRETLVVSVSHDQIAAAVGAGALNGDEAAEGAGTVECVTPVFRQKPDFDVLFANNFSVVPYAVPDMWAAYAFSYTGGALIQWCVNALAKEEKRLARETGLSVNEFLEGKSKSPTGLLVLPHFAGAATPYMDEGSKGAILGLTTASTVADLYRGCMEGVAYEMYLNLQALSAAGIRFERLLATGGGARSAEWVQMKADVTDLPVTVLETADAGTTGCAMLTGKALGNFGTLQEAAACMVREGKTFLPRKEMHGKYQELFERYRNVYSAVRPLV